MIPLILFHLIQFLRNRIWEQHSFFYVICNNLIFVNFNLLEQNTYLIKLTYYSLKQNTYLLLHIAYPYHKLHTDVFSQLISWVNQFCNLINRFIQHDV